MSEGWGPLNIVRPPQSPRKMAALLNQPTKPAQSKESAPEIMSYRQRLYDRETLMLPNEPWNPAARLAQVRTSRQLPPRWVAADPQAGVARGARDTRPDPRERAAAVVGAAAAPHRHLAPADSRLPLPMRPRRAQMRDNYDRLVQELGVSPRGTTRRAAEPPVQLPRVPQGRQWKQPGDQSSRKSPPPGAQTARERRVGYGRGF